MIDFLLGACAMASFVVGLFFLRFYRSTRDRLFAFFALAFLLDAVNRALEVSWRLSDEASTAVYFIRFLSFMLILVAIVDKNRPVQR